MKILNFFFLASGLLFFTPAMYAQTVTYSKLNLLFGDLPMDKEVKTIIELAQSNKKFKGQTHYNLDLSYSGVLIKTDFFRQKPNACFVEIVSNAQELFNDSTLTSYSCFTFDASYTTTDTLLITKEFNRIVDFFAQDFVLENVQRSSETASFYLSDDRSKPTLTLNLQNGNCYRGRYCIKLYYFRK